MANNGSGFEIVALLRRGSHYAPPEVKNLPIKYSDRHAEKLELLGRAATLVALGAAFEQEGLAFPTLHNIDSGDFTGADVLERAGLDVGVVLATVRAPSKHAVAIRQHLHSNLLVRDFVVRELGRPLSDDESHIPHTGAVYVPLRNAVDIDEAIQALYLPTPPQAKA